MTKPMGAVLLVIVDSCCSHLVHHLQEDKISASDKEGMKPTSIDTYVYMYSHHHSVVDGEGSAEERQPGGDQTKKPQIMISYKLTSSSELTQQMTA